jgi:cell division septation protein DedD
MTFKDDIKRKTGEFLTSSQEMFETIFAQATRELKIRRKPKAAVQKPVAAPAPQASRTDVKKPEAATSSGKTVPTYKTSEKVKANIPPKPKAKPSSRKGSRLLRTSLLFILLLVLAGFAANYFAIIDFSAIPDLLGLSPKPIVQAPIPRKQPAKPSETPVRPPSQPQAQETIPAPAPAPSTPTPPAVSKEEKLVELETPTTITPLHVDKEQVQEKAPSAPAPDQTKPAEITPRKELSPVTVQIEVLEKPSVPTVARSKPSTPRYPYSVYLGSFKAADAVRKAISDYQVKGLSAYWVKVDLGDKGVWYRFFTGYFRTKEEAEKYINERNLQGATPGITKFANFIDSYGSDKEAEDRKQAIVSAGFYPYVIKDAEGRFLLYSGAFDRKEYADKERTDLAAKGIKSEAVER